MLSKNYKLSENNDFVSRNHEEEYFKQVFY